MRESRTSGSEGGAACGLSLPLSWSAGACSRLLPTQSTLSILHPFPITPQGRLLLRLLLKLGAVEATVTPGWQDGSDSIVP